ncbi:hypothetical protein C5167_042746 [Papaver somniferum]|uniref:Kinesin motor domain-containing protein n=1 Tax=Papaver somniferum TaxID=3469 RepID=A0A4Y7L6V1_PAPSO|nr:hypothetical protein C5167_042746 [Papaver somniferum]
MLWVKAHFVDLKLDFGRRWGFGFYQFCLRAVEGKTVKESQFINLFPCVLGDVISALASKTSHSPYGNSKITHLLLSSLVLSISSRVKWETGCNERMQEETLCSRYFGPEKKVIEDDFTSAAIKTFNSRS